MIITGYKYTIEQDAIDAREQCDAYYGIPVSPDDVTQNWADYEIANLDTPIFYYIRFDESLRVVLGDPETFEVTVLNPF
tara:strand:- start:1070 stop:1306 length:237 start_codon:yes stop_codon:yes gene_type:complete